MTGPITTLKEFQGRINVDQEHMFLEAGGIRVELIGDNEQAAAVLRGLDGVVARISGEQEGAQIRYARLAPVAEAVVEEESVDPALAQLLPLAQNPPAVLKDAMTQAGNKIVGIRPGYRITAGASEPALVVLTKGALSAEQLGISERVGAVLVDVQPADAEEQLLGAELLPEWTQLLTGASLEAAGGEPPIKYEPPDDVTLEECRVNNILCHVGPDAGWKMLERFLDATDERLTVAMYDFNATQIIDTLVSLGKNSERSLELVLQEDKANETQAVADIEKAWKQRMQYTRASVHGTNRIFNNSFHTKVAVRDGKAIWLSSGNWSRNSQPVIPDGPQPTMYRLGNREWHVIIADDKLSDIFEKFIQYDFKKASEVAQEESLEEGKPDLLVPETFFSVEEAAVVQPAPFEPQTFPTAGGTIKVQPVMTPYLDNYPDKVLELIESAEESLWMQYSYIYKPKGNDRYKKLVMAVAARMKAGLDVRVIVDKRNEKSSDIQGLLALKWKPEMMGLQRSPVHNKGIIVDSKITLVSSQNWSPDGTQYNRDAGLIIYSPQVAKYFGKVFDFDWNNLCDPVSSTPETVAVIAPESGPTPRGMVRVPWNDLFQES